MTRLEAPAKINLALVVGPLRPDGTHEVVTVLQRLALADTISLASGDRLAVSGFPDDTIVTRALAELGRAAGVTPGWTVEISKSIPVAAGLGGGSSDAAAALVLANETLPAPLTPDRLLALAATIGADVPFFLESGPQLGTSDGTVLRPLELPEDYWVVLVMPTGVVKSSTRDVYRAFDERSGEAGFESRRDTLLSVLAGVRTSTDLALLPPNDLATSPVAERLRSEGAFRADVSGAGPCVYGLFTDRDPRRRRGRRLARGGGDLAHVAALDLAAAQLRRHVGAVAGSERPPVRVHSASRFTGAWPSGKATGFGPVIPGSNPGAPANVPTVPDSRPKLAAVVMAGGRGTRMRSAIPKHLHPLLGRRMVDWIVEAARPLGADPLVVVVSPETAGQFEGLAVAVQERPLGTGDAVRSAEAAVTGADEVLVLSGDTPLLTTELLESLLETHRTRAVGATVLSFVPDDIRNYGRIVRGSGGDLESIVEAGDATPEQLAIGEANSSIYVFQADLLWPALGRLQPVNAQGELYLTDAVRDLVQAGHGVAVHVAPDPAETEGVNTRVELAAAAAALRDRINAAHMLAGVTIVDPKTTWIEPTVTLAADTVVHPFTMLGGDTSVAEGAEIGPHAVVVDADVGAEATIGPFCYVRPGTVLGARSKAGTFVEIKNTRLGEGAKVPHLSYVGDAEIGAETNIGAGSITANFDHRPGVPKQRTVIGRKARVGVDTVFVAPVTLGDDVWTAAGTVVTEDVPDNALVGFPPRQSIKEGLGGKRDR